MLILDEATSALDRITEQALMENIESLGGRKTVVMIAHRFSTVRKCDVIYVMESGCIVESGSYDELLEMGGRFLELAGRKRCG